MSEPVFTPMGQSIRRYVSGGVVLNTVSAMETILSQHANSPVVTNGENMFVSVSSSAVEKYKPIELMPSQYRNEDDYIVYHATVPEKLAAIAKEGLIPFDEEISFPFDHTTKVTMRYIYVTTDPEIAVNHVLGSGVHDSIPELNKQFSKTPVLLILHLPKTWVRNQREAKEKQGEKMRWEKFESDLKSEMAKSYTGIILPIYRVPPEFIFVRIKDEKEVRLNDYLSPKGLVKKSSDSAVEGEEKSSASSAEINESLRKLLNDFENTQGEFKFLKNLGIEKGDNVIEIGIRNYVQRGVVAAGMGAHYTHYELDKESFSRVKNDIKKFEQYLKEFTGEYRYINGEFSRGKKSKSNDINDKAGYIEDHSQDVIIAMTGALSGPLPVSDAREVFREMLRVIKSGGTLVIRSYGIWESYEQEKFKEVKESVLNEEEWKGKIMIVKVGDTIRGYNISYDFDVYKVNLANSSPLNENNNDLGGIDLRALPIATEAIPGADSPFLGSAPISLNINFDEECRQIETMLNNDFIPATARIRDMAFAASRSSQMSNKRIEVVITHIAEILRKQEQKLILTEPALKQILIELESDKPANELQLALGKITVLPKNTEANSRRD